MVIVKVPKLLGHLTDDLDFKRMYKFVTLINDEGRQNIADLKKSNKISNIGHITLTNWKQLYGVKYKIPANGQSSKEYLVYKDFQRFLLC